MSLDKKTPRVEPPAQEPLEHLIDSAKHFAFEVQQNKKHSLTWLEGCAQTLLDEIEALRGARPSPPPAEFGDELERFAVDGLKHGNEQAVKSRNDKHESRYWEGWSLAHYNMRNKIREVFAASPPPATPQEWQPIETAPKDRPILVFMRDDAPHRAWAYEDHDPSKLVALASWTNHNGGGWVSYHPGQPTYWMPLPAAPHWADTPGQP